MTPDPLSKASEADLLTEWTRTERTTEAGYRRLGKLMYWLAVRLELDIHSHMGKVALGRKLRLVGATESALSHATVAAKVYATVGTGMTEAEYEALSYRDMEALARAPRVQRTISRGISPPRSSARRDAVAAIRAEEPDDTALDSAPLHAPDEPRQGDMDRLRGFLATAQEALLAARGCLDKRTPRTWDDDLARSLTHLGRVRFEASSFRHPGPADALDLSRF